MMKEKKAISILVAEDSPTQRQFLLALLQEAGGFDVVGVAVDGLEAVRETERLSPDIVLMDCHMPLASGIEATRMIMEKFPTPIVIVSSTLTREEIAGTFDAIKSGALAFLPKPTFENLVCDTTHSTMIQTLRLMAEVKVVGRRVRSGPSPRALQLRHKGKTDMIAVGGSTGAPSAIADILSVVASRRVAPLLIVQHMAAGFVEGFARWLTDTTKFPVSVGSHGIIATPGHAYLSPDNRHMGVDSARRIVLSDGPPEEGFRPSVNFLFRSVSEHFGSSSIGVLLTGMGRDGAAGLLALRRAGGMTFAQDEASCVVFGMPREAIALGAAQHILPPNAIGKAVSEMSENVGA